VYRNNEIYALYHLLHSKQQTDLLIGIFGTSAIRNKLVDSAYPIFKNPLAIVIPKPILETRSNFLNAILQPFHLDVYISIIHSFLCFTVNFEYLLFNTIDYRFGCA